MLEKAPESRFASMHDLSQSLEVLLAEHGGAARSTPPGIIRVTPASGVKRISSERDATLAADSGEIKGPKDELKKRESEPTLPTPTDLKSKPSGPARPAAAAEPAPQPAAKSADAAAPPERDFSEVTQAVRSKKTPWLAIGLAGGGVVAIAIAAFVVFGRHESQPAGDDKTYIVVDDRHDGSSTAKVVTPPPVTVDAGAAVVETPRADAGTARTTPKPPPTETDVGALTRTFSSQGPAITACFSKNGNPTEQVSVRIQIDTKGIVQAAEVLPGSVGSSPLGACLVAIAKQTHFGPQPKPAAFRVPLHIDAR